ncbi:hypothetical protein AU255_16610 [Methyloprofundus sedimenti]|uniref:Type I restriction modification DNA specificity domain-containing protein n=1 Tax=Methyloprofundus sedimenti TaxID=1420851 RepID=A0A1V8M2Q2_9GAMM|nr:restriction endonuclease subunit S [Methyloprofundus sedimenti]OQK15812.1 hypothetical protein AU255_16610 [Methyloprofundus sedimenti]
MADTHTLITEYIDIWTSAIKKRSSQGRGSNKKIELTGIKKLRELILELAVRGQLVPQDPNDEPASVLLKRIAAEKEQLIKDKKIKPSKALPEIGEDEKPFELPDGWEWSKNIDLFTLTKGKKPKNLSENNIGSPYLDIEALDRGNILRYTDDEKCPRSTNKDILVVCDGSRSGLVLDGKDGVIGSTLAIIETPTYIQVYVKLFFRQAFQRLNSSMKGAAIPHLDTKSLREGLFAVPPFKEQYRIVAKVDELMALCDQLEQQTENSITAHQTLVETLLATLTSSENTAAFNQSWTRIAAHFDTLFTTEHSIDQLKQTVLQLAVIGKLVPQNPNDEPASVLLKKIAAEKEQLIKDKKIKKSLSVDNIIRENCDWSYPKQWSKIELQDLFKFIDYRGKNPAKSDKGKRIITAKNIRMGFIKNDPIEYISEELYKSWMVRGFPQIGDILFVTEGHTMGFVSLVELEYEFALAQRTICFQPFMKFDTTFFLYVLMSQQFQDIIKDNQTGSAAGGIKASKLKKVPVPFPPLAEQHRIVKKADELMTLCDQLKTRLSQAQTTQLHLADTIVEQAIN